MTDVTVKLEDLERIIFAASAVKKIEATLAAFKSDPFVKPHLEFTEAATRLEAAMRSAHRSAASARGDTLIDYDGPMTDKEQKELLRLHRLFEIADRGYTYILAAIDKAPQAGEAMSVYDRLAAKGMVRMGQIVSGVIWPGDDRPSMQTEPKFALVLTARGIAAAEAMKVKAL